MLSAAHLLSNARGRKGMVSWGFFEATAATANRRGQLKTAAYPQLNQHYYYVVCTNTSTREQWVVVSVVLVDTDRHVVLFVAFFTELPDGVVR